MTMFIILIIIGAVIYFAMRGRQDRPEQLGASRRALPTGSIEPQSFACPYPKCPTCGASGDKMKKEWDGLRAVKWSCNYCSAVAGVQTLKDEELPTSARRRLGMDSPAQGAMPMQPGGYGQGGGMGGLLTGMMLGSMMGGGHRDHDHSDRGDGWGGGASGGSSSDWGESNSNSGSSDWGESGGGDSGGDSGGDW